MRNIHMNYGRLLEYHEHVIRIKVASTFGIQAHLARYEHVGIISHQSFPPTSSRIFGIPFRHHISEAFLPSSSLEPKLSVEIPSAQGLRLRRVENHGVAIDA